MLALSGGVWGESNGDWRVVLNLQAWTASRCKTIRCFGSEEQTARLAPLTLLVGPNSTGKTSFLALIRALWDVAFREVVPNFPGRAV